ncbi:unnamed protein product [Pseudo-nitzschia multistriata]|uniref:Aspartyl/asparaginy/proline hydroxylase domain-containing protein n=1 Tax=Pseudo-nitzschia multistriata TaxID=183589 RepID=A0A448ZEX6_9STRA|nr:unnamed protein product [Pseudo-nitzschia multistriata]
MNGANTTERTQSAAVSSCKNPDCIRCRRYRYVQERARSKLSWILRDLRTRDESSFSKLNRRIPNAIIPPETMSSIDNSRSGGGNNNQALCFQNPTVLMVQDLPSKEIVTDWHQNVVVYLKKRQARAIVFEALDKIENNSRIKRDGEDDSNWTVNDTSPQGHWKVFHILNQGVWNPMLLSENENGKETYLDLLDLIHNIPGLLNNCLFGNVFVSKIYPGTDIEPHCGPTNIRHRLQFLLKLPGKSSPVTHSSVVEPKNNDVLDGETEPALSLSVGRIEKITWNADNDAFVFDDSFIHSVTYRNDDSAKEKLETENFSHEDDFARVVLIVDLWHPNLQESEKMILQHSYPPFTIDTCKQ